MEKGINKDIQDKRDIFKSKNPLFYPFNSFDFAQDKLCLSLLNNSVKSFFSLLFF